MEIFLRRTPIARPDGRDPQPVLVEQQRAGGYVQRLDSRDRSMRTLV